MADRWGDMLASLDDGQAGYWRNRLAMAETLIDAFQTGQIIEATPAVRQLLFRLADDPKWEVRKVIANGLNLIEDAVFDDLSTRLLSDANGFVKRSAEQSYGMRRRDHRRNRKRDAVDRQLAKRLSKLRDRYGPDAVEDVIVDPDIERYIVQIAAATRVHQSVLVGVSPRGSLALIKLARAAAALDGRDFVIPDDIKELASDALAHRLILSPELWSKRVTDRDIVASVVGSVPVPKVS